MSILNFAPEREERKAGSWLLVFVLLFVGVGGFFLKTTLAANVSLNNGLSVEFGQGVAATTACSGSSVLTMTPNSSFTNSGGSTGSFYFKSVTVSGIPSSCNGQDFNISAYDSSTGSAPLSLFNGSSTTAPIWDNGGSFQGGHGFIGSSVTSLTGSFTVTFTVPVALASNVSKLTLQSIPHVAGNCATENICSVGDTGPGGGIVFYVSSAFSETGATCGSNCHYLEWAPVSWASTQSQNSSFIEAGTATTDAGTYVFPASSLLGTVTSLGSGFNNTSLMANASSPGTSSTNAAIASRLYAGNDSSSGQWFLPSQQELILMAQSSVQSTGGFQARYYWTSTESNASAQIEVHMPDAGVSADAKGATNSHLFRPIRAF